METAEALSGMRIATAAVSIRTCMNKRTNFHLPFPREQQNTGIDHHKPIDHESVKKSTRQGKKMSSD